MDRKVFTSLTLCGSKKAELWEAKKNFSQLLFISACEHPS